jgi:hypothetical protein
MHMRMLVQTRLGCCYLKQLCIDEFDLHREFFNLGQKQLWYVHTLVFSTDLLIDVPVSAYLENLWD